MARQRASWLPTWVGTRVKGTPAPAMLASVNAGDHKPPACFLKACSLQFHAIAGEPNYRSLSVLVLEVVRPRDMPVIGEGKDPCVGNLRDKRVMPSVGRGIFPHVIQCD